MRRGSVIKAAYSWRPDCDARRSSCNFSPLSVEIKASSVKADLRGGVSKAAYFVSAVDSVQGARKGGGSNVEDHLNIPISFKLIN